MLTQVKPLYNAVVLTEHSKKKLASFFEGMHSVKFGHHITTEFKPESVPDNEGQFVLVTIVGYAKDERGEAVVAIPHGVNCKNKTPHITVSCADGTKPFYSNKLLAGGFTKLKCPIHLTGKVTSIFP